MLRGLDTRAAGTDYEPTIVKVADRSVVTGRPTVYAEANPSPKTRRRLCRIRERLALFADADVVPNPTFVTWRAATAEQTEEQRPIVGDRCEEFRQSVGSEAIVPFFEDETGAHAPPDICLAIRRGGRLRGLYPRLKDGHVQTVEECLVSMAAGNDVENVAD
ncbi:MAG: hypothetical protein ACI8UR_001911 [Natronomonas sp.]|jgi:hypothetical protein|uniref:HTH domain-containing protein n=1 Tax=Natronomonas sp. TaxID=2184060 RepID=UPI00398A2329